MVVEESAGDEKQRTAVPGDEKVDAHEELVAKF